MRKISKISLVAAVAVAGLVSANAQPLEQAIKNVEVSGSVVYRYDNFDDSKRTTNQSYTDVNKYKIGLNLSSVVNEYVKFNSRFIVGSDKDADFAALSAQDGGADKQAEITLSNAYFALTAVPNTVVNIGKQGLTTPWTVAVDATGNEQNGTGILALTNVGAVTAGAGYFNNQNLNQSGQVKSLFKGHEDLYVATVQGDLDFVKLEAWYLGAQDVFNSYTLAATSKIDLAEDAKLGLEARYVDLKLDEKTGVTGNDKKNSMFKFAVNGKFGIVNARLAYTKTGKHGGTTAADNDAKNTSLGWALTANGASDANFYQAALGADILSNLNFTLNYAQLNDKEVGGTEKGKEVYGQLTYKMSKNLNTYVRYGNVSEKNVAGTETRDENRGRIQVAYTF